MLERCGAVSEPVARVMAEAARTRSGVDLAVAVTGIAGPGGGSDAKPVGLVHLATAGPDGLVQHACHVFAGDRHTVRMAAVEAALGLTRKALAGRATSTRR
jgi:nicotinamide-nucleotide amidase